MAQVFLKHFLILICLCLFSFKTYSQSFPKNRKKFISYVQKSYSHIEKSYVQNFIKGPLKKSISDPGVIDEDYFNQIVDYCNNLKESEIKEFPGIFYYLNTAYFLKDKQDKLQEWEGILDKHIELGSKKSINYFLKFSYFFFKYGKIGDAKEAKWFCRNGSYDFSFKNKKVTMTFKNTDLLCLHSNKSSGAGALDSIVLLNTNGKYDIKTKKWIGHGGTLTWEKVKISKEISKAEINKYAISTKSKMIIADSAQLYMPYLKEPVFGRIMDKADVFVREIDKVYPTFSTYENRIEIKELFKNIDYNGGFLIQGKKLIGAGDKSNLASIIVKHKGKELISIKSLFFEISNSSVSAKDCKVKIFIDNDSITHRQLSFSYQNKYKQLELLRPEKGMGNTPFENHYHMFDMFVSRILYSVGKDELRLHYPYNASEDLKYAKFESKNFFDESLYNSFKGFSRENPISKIATFALMNEVTKVHEGKVASLLNKSIDQAKPILINMAMHGFITYDLKDKTININKKLINYDAFQGGNIDYDELIFESKLSSKNKNNKNNFKKIGTINLISNELNIDGIESITVSKINETYIYPNLGHVIINKNRNINFNGWIVCGKLETKTLVSNYNYKSHLFNLDQCLYTTFRVNPLKKEHGSNKILLKSHLSAVKGKLYVGDSTNRSKTLTDSSGVFPKLIIPKKTYVYYNRILKGSYDSSRFYYEIDPFTIDNLQNFDENTFLLNGKLISAGIFPEIEMPLKIMNDYSLGFIKKSPESGYAFYGTNAKYNNKIALSNNGLQGSGTINFIQSISKSNIFTFLPDSTIGYANFENKPKENDIEFPDISCKKSYIRYLPKKEILFASSTQKMPLKFFDNEAQLTGRIRISKNGITGKGDMGFKTAYMKSNLFKFTRWDIKADTSSFNLKNIYRKEGDDPLALSTEGVSADISFKERKGEFNSDISKEIKFPSNLFYCKMDKFYWEMDGSTVDMEKSEATTFQSGGIKEESNFFSYHPDQEKLNFKALSAKYDLKSQEITCSKLNYVPIGDVQIFPDSSTLVIRKEANIKPLKEAQIQTISKTHNFKHCNLKITSKSAYSGNGAYQYYDVDSLVTSIQMNNIECINSRTKASGKIEEKNKFKLNKHFEYFGDISIISTNPGIDCKGSTKLIHDCKNFEKNWMYFEDTIIAKKVMIPFFDKNAINRNGDKIIAGFSWRLSDVKDSIVIYPSFLSKVKNPDDPILFSSNGYIEYNEARQEYQISSKNALKDRSNQALNLLAVSTENFLTLDTRSCSMRGEGEIKLGMDYGDVKFNSYGNVEYNEKSKKSTFNISMRIDMPIDKNVMESFANKIKLVDQYRPMDLKKSNFERAMMHWSNEKTTKKIIESYIQDSKPPKFPSEFENTFFFTGIKLISFDRKNKEERGLQSNSGNAYLVGIYKKPIMKNIPIRIFMEQITNEKKIGDKFAFHFSLPNEKKYFFQYQMEKKNGIMLIETNDKSFEKLINDIKPDKRKIKNFRYEITEEKIYYNLFNNLFY